MKAAITRNILIICFIICVLFTFSGISIRLDNESRNKSLVPVADYFEFLKASDAANMDFEDVLRRLKDSGVSAIALQESIQGFDINVLNKLKSMGFEIILRPDIYEKYNSDYLNKFEKVVKDFNIKYLIFNGSESSGQPDSINVFQGIINKYKLITGIIENTSQTGYVRQAGLDRLIINTCYAVNRVYIIPDNDLESISSGEVFYRWLRCAVDRNIRFIYIRPLRNTGLTYSGNLNNTIKTVGEFDNFISKSSFTINNRLNILSSKMPPNFHYYAVSLSLLFALMLYIFFLFGPKVRTILLIAVIGAAAVIISNIIFGENMAGWWATIAAILYPSFSSLLLLLYLKKNAGSSFPIQIISSMVILLGINCIGMYTVVTTLADIRYTMGMQTYMGVTVSFILPVIFFAVNYFGCFVGFEKTKEFFAKLMNFRINTQGALLILFFCIVFYVYIARSGNDMGIHATTLELKFREVLEKLLLVRPRFKEFLIGYPALFVMIYLFHRYKKSIILLMLGIAVVMGSVSMVNSFCHVFTPVTTSLTRTLNGLVSGLMVGIFSIFVVRYSIFFYNAMLEKERR